MLKKINKVFYISHQCDFIIIHVLFFELKIKYDSIAYFILMHNKLNNEYNKLVIDLGNSKNDILIIEPNTLYHSECLPGYIKYFKDLGCDVDLILSKYNYDLLPFCRLNMDNYILFPIEYYINIRKIVSEKELLKKYKVIFFTTSYSIRGDLLPTMVSDKSKLLLLSHSLESLISLHSVYNNVIGIMYFKNIDFKYVNPHYYGNIEITKKNKDIVRFISVGRMTSNVKDYSLLVRSVKSLIENKCKNFKVILIGWEGTFGIEDEYRDFIEVKGKLNFRDLFNEMENADFVLSLLNPNNDMHMLYASEIFTGLNQLVLGFRKPYIINRVYAEAYLYDEKNSVVYDNNLCKAMFESINMDDRDYSSLQSNISQLSTVIYANSLNNLKFFLSKYGVHV